MKVIIYLVVFLFSISFRAQTISGKIRNSNNAHISNVSIIVYEGDNILTYTFSNNKGFIIIDLKKIKTLNIRVFVSKLGYESQEIKLELKTQDTIV